MIPRIARGGCSFKGAAAYYLHDKAGDTRERVEWTQTLNVLTQDPDKAWKVMAYTALEADRLKEASGQKRTGRKLTKPVFSYSLSRHPEQQPDRPQMMKAALQSLRALGLTEHQALIVAHRDEPQPHLHILVNRVHPLTGLAGDLKHSKRTLSDFAREHEQQHGKVYCPQREANHAKRQRKEPSRYRDPVITEAWQRSDDGPSFVAALQSQGYHLAQGRKRLVVVDRYGQTHNPVRHLENVRAAQFQQRLKACDLTKLPQATPLSRSIQQENRQRYDASLRHDTKASVQKNRMQDRHLAERAALSDRHQDRISREADRLAEYYDLAAQKRNVEALQDKVSQPSVWSRVTGRNRVDEARLASLSANYDNARSRYEERLDALAKRRNEEAADLDKRQAAQKQRLEERLETKRPANYLDAAEREQLRPHLPPRGHSRDGPELGR